MRSQLHGDYPSILIVSQLIINECAGLKSCLASHKNVDLNDLFNGCTEIYEPTRPMLRWIIISYIISILRQGSLIYEQFPTRELLLLLSRKLIDLFPV